MEEIGIMQHVVLFVPADEEVFVGRMTTVDVDSNSAVSSSVCTHAHIRARALWRFAILAPLTNV